jgi:hypothetical protein
MPQTFCNFDLGTMAKDKSEKKKHHVSDAVTAAVEEDVEMGEMQVNNLYACPGE